MILFIPTNLFFLNYITTVNDKKMRDGEGNTSNTVNKKVLGSRPGTIILLLY